MENQLYKIIKKRGFLESIKILMQAERKELVQCKFFDRLNETASYYNAFLRSKPDLLKYKIIKYRLNQDNDYVIALTEKGKKIGTQIQEIEKLLKNSNSSKKEG